MQFKVSYSVKPIIVIVSLVMILQAINIPVALAQGPTEVRGTIGSDTTWTAAESPYLLTGNVIVGLDATLTIEPGVTVKGRENRRLEIQGHLKAVGTSANPIIFTSELDNEGNQWQGIYFSTGGTGHLNHTVVRYGGYWLDSRHSNIYVAQVKPSGEVLIENSRIESAGTGTEGAYGMVIEASELHQVRLVNTSFSNNFPNRIGIRGGTIPEDATLVNQAGLQGYDLINDVTIGTGATLTVEPGVTVKGNDDKRLQIQGDLQAIGTTTNPITFTSITDNEGNQWQGLYFNGGTGYLNNTIIRYGGYWLDSRHSNIYIHDVAETGQVVIENSLIEGAGTNDSLAYPIGIEATELHLVTLTNNRFQGNSVNRIELYGGTIGGHATLAPQIGYAGYGLNRDVTIGNEASLTVLPGTVVMGRDDVRLEIQGHLTASGTTTNPITFTSTVDDDGNQWQGLYFNGGTGYLNNTIIRYGGYWLDSRHSNIYIHDVAETGQVVIENSLIEGAGTNDSLAYPIGIEATELHLVTLTNNRFQNNSVNRIELYGGTIGGHATLAPQIGYAGYGLNRNVTIGNEASLTVLPGTVVMGRDEVRLEIQGHLTASGTTSNPITFTSTIDDDGNQWQGLYFNGGTGYLNNTVIRYGGDWLDSRHSNIYIRDVAEADQVVIENSLFEGAGTNDDTAYPIFIEATDLHLVKLTNNTFQNNPLNQIYINTGTIGGDATLTSQIGLDAFRMSRDGVTVGEAVTLTVEAGVIVKSNGWIETVGHLESRGTVTNPVIFTSNDDTEPGQWQGLWFSAATGHLNHTIVRFGNPNITIEDASSNVSIENSQIENSSRYGISVSNGQLTTSCTTFTKNSSGLSVGRNATAKVAVGNSNFEENSTAGLSNVSDLQVQAVNNYWGDPSGPAHEDNPNGLGEAVSGNVDYQPWNIAPCDTIPPVVAGNASISGQVEIEDETISLNNIVAVAYRQAGLGWNYTGVATATVEGDYTISDLSAGTYRVYFFDQSGVHISQYYNNASSFGLATYIDVAADSVTPNINASLKKPASPLVLVDGDVSTGVDPTTGAVSIISPRRSNQLTITSEAICVNGETPADVTLIIGSATFPMTALGQNQYAVVLTIPDDLPTGVREYEMVVSYSCGAEEQATEAGEIVLIDPSGQVTDMTTGQPITSAIVTLYRVPDALPDTATETRDCRTVDTRGGNNWSNLPAASLDEGIVVNPELGLINASQEISPTVNPQTTGRDGRYAWDVVEGCWYVAVEAEGYHTLVSPVVGVPPEVTDLDMALNPLARPPSVYLPIVVK